MPGNFIPVKLRRERMVDDVTDGCIIVVNDEGNRTKTSGYSNRSVALYANFSISIHTHTHTYALSILTRGFTINFPHPRNERFNFAGLSKLILASSEILNF